MNQDQVNQEVSGAQQQGQNLQNQYNQQAGQTYGQYQNAVGGANQAQANLQNFTGKMQNGQQMYGQNLQNAQSMYGFDPTMLLKANQALANTATTIANLPQAIQQQGNYYGTTAGQEAGNYANQAGNLNTVEQGQSNAANAFQQVLAASQNQANQQTTQGLASQAQQLAGYQSAAQNATNVMQQSEQTMKDIEGLQQQQGFMTAQQVSAYQNAYSNYISAQAAQTQASAALMQAQAQSALTRLQTSILAKAHPGGVTLPEAPPQAAEPGMFSSQNIGQIPGVVGHDIGAFTNWLKGFGFNPQTAFAPQVQMSNFVGNLLNRLAGAL